MNKGGSASASSSKKLKAKRQSQNATQVSALSEQIKEMTVVCGDFDEHGNFVAPSDSTELPIVNGTNDTLKKKTKSSKKPRRKDGPRKDVSMQESTAYSPVPVNNSPTPPWMGKTPSQLYAAPNFSNSPAASALPIPKFAMKNLSKSLPNSTSQPSLQSRLDQDQSPLEGPSDSSSSSSSPTPSPTPQHARPVQDVRKRQESPLDFLFEADRAHKSSNALPIASSVASPPTKSVYSSTSNQKSPLNNNNATEVRAAEKDSGRNYSPQFQPGIFYLSPRLLLLSDILTPNSSTKSLGIYLW
jgi:hypothetical protein